MKRIVYTVVAPVVLSSLAIGGALYLCYRPDPAGYYDRQIRTLQIDQANTQFRANQLQSQFNALQQQYVADQNKINSDAQELAKLRAGKK